MREPEEAGVAVVVVDIVVDSAAVDIVDLVLVTEVGPTVAVTQAMDTVAA
jgi:hypothetical protein